MDEKKTYLVNIESNLKTYAEEAAKAKKVADELKISLDELKKSGAKPEEIEAATAAHKNANDEYRKAASLFKTAIANNLSETGSRKQLSEQLKLQEQALGKLGSAYIKDAQGILRLNPAYVEQRKQIAATKQQIIDYDLALKDGRSNVGRYGATVKAAIGDVASSMFAFAAPIAVATAALNGLKEAFLGTEAGAKLLSRTKLQLSAFFESIVTGNFKYAFGNQLPKDIKAAADLLDEIRKDERAEQVGIAQRELEIKNLRLESVKAGKGTVEQEGFLVQAQQKEEELILFKLGHKEEELAAVNLLLEKQKTNTVLLNKQAQLEAEILNIKGEKSLRMATKLQTIEEKRIADTAKAAKAEEDALQKSLKSKELMEQYTNEYFEKEKRRNQESLAEKKRMEDYTNDYFDREKKRMEEDITAGFEYQRLKAGENVDALQTILNSEYAALLASVEYTRMTDNEKLLIDQQYTDDTKGLSKLRISQQLTEVQLIGDIAGSLSGLFAKQTSANKAISVAQALISTYAAGVKAMEELPPNPVPGLRFLTMAAVIAAGLLQVKNILAVKVPGGGGSGVSAPTSISASVPAQRIYANQVAPSFLTTAQMNQQQLNAVPNQNPLTADDLAKALALAISKLNIVTTIEDINARQKSTNKIVSRANI